MVGLVYLFTVGAQSTACRVSRLAVDALIVDM